MSLLIDTIKRPLRDLRISVTDRCNFRCRYCMPAEVFGAGYEFLPKKEILRFGEIEKLVASLLDLGVKKLRITGGEPLLRRDLHLLIEKLAEFSQITDIAMTTNAVLLAKYAEQLKKAGLHRVTISFDAIEPEIFSAMNGVGAKPDRVLEGIEAAKHAGLGVKLNTVIKKGVNDSEILPLVEYAQKLEVPIRFIEYMDTGNTNQWQLNEVMPSRDILTLLKQYYEVTSVPVKILGETAKNYYLNNNENMTVGFISSVTQPFCSSCNRMRLSADGKLFNCLFAQEGLDIKKELREGTKEELKEKVTAFWQRRDDRYSELRAEGVVLPKQEMSYLGG